MIKTTLLDNILDWRQKHVTDQQFIIFLSILTGFASGLAAVVIKNLVFLLQEKLVDGFAKEYHNYLFFIFPPIGILLSVLFIKFLIRRDLGHGIPKVLYAISKEKAKIRKHNMFSSIVTSVLTVGFGGSVGFEGPSVSTGAAIGSNLGDLFRVDYKKKSLLIMCASASVVAALFKAPIAAIVFVIEVFMFDLTLTSILPILTASVTATLTSYLFLGQDVIYAFKVTELFQMNDVLIYVILGILSGILSLYFNQVYKYFHRVFDGIKQWYVRFFIGSFLLGLLIFIFPSLYGEGYEAVNMSLHGNFSYLFNNTLFYEYQNQVFFVVIVFLLVLLLKVLATSLTFAAGGVGGIFAPSLFLGATLGLFFGQILNMFGYDISSNNLALVGMAGLISGIIHAPLTGIFLIAEITGGYELFMPLMITSTISFATLRIFHKTSVYTYQLAKRGELMTHDKDKNVLIMMKIESTIETDFKPVDVNATLGDLVEVIKSSNRNIFPVIDKDNKLYGVVKLDHIRDIMFDHSAYQRIKVKDLMDLPEYVISPEQSMSEVTKYFQDSDRYTIPVVTKGKYYAGFVSRAKLFSTYRKMLRDFSEE